MKRVISTFEKRVIQRLARVFSNVWQWYFPTFGKSIFQRLARVFSNVRQKYYQGLKKLWKSPPLHLGIDIDYSHSRFTLMTDDNKRGRSVVVNSKSQKSTTHIRIWLTAWCKHLWSCGRNFQKTQTTICWCANWIDLYGHQFFVFGNDSFSSYRGQRDDRTSIDNSRSIDKYPSLVLKKL